MRNTHKTLMTRGMKGCYVYCVDNRIKNYSL
ncbi:DNA/RNA helicase domain-containing protein [Planococcus sp. 4-30]